MIIRNRKTTNNSRIVRFLGAQMKAVGDNDMTVTGYAIKFNSKATIGDTRWGWIEEISSDALKDTDLENVVLNFNHNNSDVLACTKNDSLQLYVDGTGLKVSAKIIDTTVGRDVYKMIKENLVDGMSFCAAVKGEEWIIGESEEQDTRIITEIGKLYDVSVVTFPAYDDTEVQAYGSHVQTAGLNRKSTSAMMLQYRKEVKERQLQRIWEIKKSINI